MKKVTIEDFLYKLMLKGHKVWLSKRDYFHTTLNGRKYVVFYSWDGVDDWHIARVTNHTPSGEFSSIPIPIKNSGIYAAITH